MCRAKCQKIVRHKLFNKWHMRGIPIQSIYSDTLLHAKLLGIDHQTTTTS